MLRPDSGARHARRAQLADIRWPHWLWVWLAVFVTVSSASAQPITLTLDGLGQTYRPAGLVNLEASAKEYPWLRAETQVWTGQSPLPDGSLGDVVVLAAVVRDPTGHVEMRAGRFVLTTGAVRPIHIDGGSIRVQTLAAR